MSETSFNIPFGVDLKRYLLHLIEQELVVGMSGPWSGFPESQMMQLLPWASMQAEFHKASRGWTCGVGDITEDAPHGECVYYFNDVIGWLRGSKNWD